MDNQERDIGIAVKSAAALLDKAISFDSEIAENNLKYSAWVAVLATAGFNLAVWSFDKIRGVSALKGIPTVFNVTFISTIFLLMLAIVCSGAILLVSNRYLASFKQQRTLVLQREFVTTNHLEVFKADAEVRLVMMGEPTDFIPDLMFEDLAKREGGALIEMDYSSESNEPPASETAKSYQEEKTKRVFQLLTKLAKNIDAKMQEITRRRNLDGQRLSRLLLAQQVLVALGYVGLLILAIPVR